jgi:hypothetical protein
MDAITGIGFRDTILQDGCRPEVVALDASVGADSNVLYTNQVTHVIKMIDVPLPRGIVRPTQHLRSKNRAISPARRVPRMERQTLGLGLE